MAFRMDPGLTKLVTLDAGVGVTIDGQRTRIMWANEAAILKVNGDGTAWTKIGGKTIPMVAAISQNGNLTFSAGAETLLNLSLNGFLSAPAAMQDLTNKEIVILRPGYYLVNTVGVVSNNNGSACTVFYDVHKNAGALFNVSLAQAAGIGLSMTGTDVASLSVADTISGYGVYYSGSFSTTYFTSSSLSVTEKPTW
jgi:hypothetical protein